VVVGRFPPDPQPAARAAKTSAATTATIGMRAKRGTGWCTY